MRERKGERQGGNGAPTRGPGWHSVGRRGSNSVWTETKIQTRPNWFQIPSNFDYFKHDFPWLQKFETKYGWKVFEIRNNFPYRDFLRFEMDFELKFRESSMSWISRKIDWKFLESWDLMTFGQRFPFFT
jgi:hypothetical protein